MGPSHGIRSDTEQLVVSASPSLAVRRLSGQKWRKLSLSRHAIEILPEDLMHSMQQHLAPEGIAACELAFHFIDKLHSSDITVRQCIHFPIFFRIYFREMFASRYKENVRWRVLLFLILQMCSKCKHRWTRRYADVLKMYKSRWRLRCLVNVILSKICFVSQCYRRMYDCNALSSKVNIVRALLVNNICERIVHEIVHRRCWRCIPSTDLKNNLNLSDAMMIASTVGRTTLTLVMRWWSHPQEEESIGTIYRKC